VIWILKNGISTSALETSGEQAGIGYIPSGESEIIIYNDTIKEDSLIYLTPTSSTPAENLTVVKKEPCNGNTSEVKNLNCKPYFKVSANTPAINPLTFNWLIVK